MAAPSHVTVTVVMMILIIIGVAPKGGESVITCSQVLRLTAPCIAYAVGGGPITACCNGIKAVAAGTKTLADRRTVCRCLKAASNIPNGSPATLAKQCGVKLPSGVTLSPTTNCDTIP